MTGPNLHSAVEELYSSPPAEFTTRRKGLSVAARSNGDRELAGKIAALRKPTLSADTVNRLVRAAPEALEELLDLGVALRAAEKALDAAALRDLSGTRRSLVHDLAQLAFDITEQTAPSASTRDEVVATLNAVLADDQVADRVMSGALVTQARWDGFGSTSLPELAVVIPLLRTGTGSAEPRRPTAEARPEPDSRSAKVARVRRTPTPADDAADQAVVDQAAAATEQCRIEQERLVRLEAARREADDAERAAVAAAQDIADIDRRISELGLQTAHQRELLATAQRTARSSESRRRAAQLALTRAGGR